VGVEPTSTSLSNWRLCQFAYPATDRELRAWESNPALRVYETRPSTGPPAVAEGRLELPRPGRARAPEARASAIPPPGDETSSPCGNRTRLSSLRGWCPADRPTGHLRQCVGQESNLQGPQAGGLQPLGHAHAQPTHENFSSTGGIRTHRTPGFEPGRCAGWRTVPMRRLAPPMGFEPTISTLTGWRALRAALRGQDVR
jgi:hypothetical protein